MAKILQPDDRNLRDLRKFLLSGGIVAVPTETVYGLAANAFDAEACARVFEAKRRPATDPLICHVAGFDALEEICLPNALARELAASFWPGPLTFVLPKRACIPGIVTAGLDSVAVRCSAHPDFHRLVELCGVPLAAPSANPFSYISPTTAQHVQASLGDRIEYILDGGPCALGVESTILDLRDPERPRALRHGALPVEEIEAALGWPIARPDAEAPGANGGQVAPGSSPKHYSPRAALELRGGISRWELDALPGDAAAMLLAKPAHPVGENVRWLSRDGKTAEIAANLYSVLRELDDAGYARIVAEAAPELGLGAAINDRLRRAAFR